MWAVVAGDFSFFDSCCFVSSSASFVAAVVVPPLRLLVMLNYYLTLSVVAVLGQALDVFCCCIVIRR